MRPDHKNTPQIAVTLFRDRSKLLFAPGCQAEIERPVPKNRVAHSNTWVCVNMLAKGLNGVCDISQIYHGGRVFSRLGKGINGGGLGGGATLRSFDPCSSDRFPQSESRKMSNWCSWARFGLTVAVVEFVAHSPHSP